MLQEGSILNIIDNTSVIRGRCLKVLRRSCAKSGHLVVLSVLKCRQTSKINAGQVVRGLVVSCKKEEKLLNNFIFKFKSNDVILVKGHGQFASKSDKSGSRGLSVYQPIGNRVRGYVSLNLRQHGYARVVTMSWGSLA